MVGGTYFATQVLWRCPVITTEAVGWCISIFVWLYLTGIGIPPVPEEAGILYSAGVTALHSDVHWWLAWPATSLGILCADITLYGIGRLFGPRLFQYRWVSKLIGSDRRKRIESKFQKHGFQILMTARFLPPLRTGIFIVAGALHYPFLSFLIPDAIFGVIGVGVVFFGSTLVINLIHQAGSWLVYTLAAVAIVVGLFKFFQYLKRREEKEPLAPVSVLDLPLEQAMPAAPQGSREPTKAQKIEVKP